MHAGESYSDIGAGHGGESPVVRTGFAELDNLIGGLYAGDLVLVESRPGVGKTRFAAEVALSAIRSDVSVCFFSLDRQKDQIEELLCSAVTGIPMAQVRWERQNDTRSMALDYAEAYLGNANLRIFDETGLGVPEIRSMALQDLLSEPRLIKNRIVIVDHLQLVSGHFWDRGRTRDQYATIMCNLKALALELGASLLVTSQLDRRSMRHWLDRRYPQSEFPWTVVCRQLADTSLILDRSLDADEAKVEGRPDVGLAKIIVTKKRCVSTDEVPLAFRADPPEFTSICTQGSDKPFTGDSGLARVVLQVVASHYGVSADDLLSHNESWRISEPQGVAMYLCRTCGDVPFASVGRIFDRDHSFAMHKYSVVEKRMLKDALFRTKVMELKVEINALLKFADSAR